MLFKAMISVVCLLLLVGNLQALSPVVFIPGTGGNQLEAKLNKPSSTHFYCAKTSDWYRIWISVTQFLPGSFNCFTDNMRLVYDETADRFNNPPGVETRVPGNFGDTEPTEYLDPSLKLSTSVYFSPILEALLGKGYERRKSVFAATYDFRLGPLSNENYHQMTVDLIEKAYQMNNNTPVTLISHSMGGLWSQYILNKQTKEWKDKYIKIWITLNGVFGGSIKTMKVMASGDNEGVKSVTGRDARVQQRTFESNFWLMPNPKYWEPNYVFVQTPNKNYTVSNYEEFFNDINYSLGIKIRKRVASIPSEAPEVPTLVLYGTGVETTEKAIYNNGFETDPEEIGGDGDGTVNRRSLEVPLSWRSQQKEPVEAKTFPGGCHNCLLSDQGAIDLIIKTISNN